MEQRNETNLFSDLTLDHESKQHIRTMATWAMVVVVVTVVGYLLSIVELVAPKEKTVRAEGFDFGLKLGGSTNVISSVVAIIIGLIICFFLYRFSTQAKRSLDGMNQQLLNSSFNNLKTYFMISSVFIIIVFVFVLLAMVFILIST